MKRPSKRSVFIVALVVAGCVGGLLWWTRDRALNDWVEIGVGGPAKDTEFRYRYIELVTPEGVVRTSHPDLVTLTMELQRGKAEGAWVYLPIVHCYAPQVRDGLPSLMCESLARSDVIIAAKDEIREKLLSLSREGQRAAVRAQAIGVYADTPVLLVVDDRTARYHP